MKGFSMLCVIITCLSAYSKTELRSGRAFEYARHDINNITLVITNFGTFCQDETGYGGCWWQYSGIGNTYIRGAGIWFGAIDSLGDTLVTIGYGPSGGQFEFSPGLCGWSVSDPDAIIYMYGVRWPPNHDRLPMAPQEARSHQDSWCVYNDCDSVYHMPGDTRPMGIEIYQTVYAWHYPVLEDAIFLIFQAKNVSGNILRDCYFSICMDSDIGNEAGTPFPNDLCGCIVERIYIIDGDTIFVDDLVYNWQEIPEAGWPIFPAVTGFDLIQTPFDLEWGQDKDGDGIPDQHERDSTYYVNNLPQHKWDVDNDGLSDWRDPSENPQLGLTSFKRFTLDLEPSRDNDRYLVMAGYNFVTGQYEPYDTTTPDPDDFRFLMSSGPFDLEPDSTATLVLGLMLAQWHGIYQTPDTAIVMIDHFCQLVADMNWQLPSPPPPPGLISVPGDAKITLIWDKAAENEPDQFFDIVGDSTSPYFEPLYRQYDFEGYGVWKSIDGIDWQLLTRYDIYNDIVFEDTLSNLYATNTGLLHYYIDTDLRNGFTYYYALSSFDCNFMEDIDSSGNPYARPFWLEGEKVSVAAVPRREPANYVPGGYSVEIIYGNPILADSNVKAVITYPLQMTDDLFYLDFGTIEYAQGDPSYRTALLNADEILIDSASIVISLGDQTFYDFGTHNGFNIIALLQREEIPANISIFDQVEVETGVYPESLLTPRPMNVLFGNWAYRGNDYEVHWIKAHGSDSVNSVIVIDKHSGDTIPYAEFKENVATDSLAQSWSFHVTTGNVSDTLIYDPDPAPPYFGTKYLYICGGKINLAGGLGLDVGDPRPSADDVWTVYARTDLAPAPANARLQITPIPAQLGTDMMTLNVKVCPNPYIITNEWQQTLGERRLRFINLPGECVIRIFNLNGELVKLIRHKHTSEGGVIGDLGGDEWWDGLNEYRQLVASGTYIFYVQSPVGEQVGKFVIVQ